MFTRALPISHPIATGPQPMARRPSPTFAAAGNPAGAFQGEGMRTRKSRLLGVTMLAAIGAAAYAAISLAGPVSLTNVPNANTKSQGFSPASVLSPELQQTAVAQGSTRVENPAVAPGPTN